jgi:hypothetical protein
MTSYLRPRRGKKTTAESQNIVLKRGEVFFESPGGGVGTGTGRIKVGDGTTAYTSLPYFLNPDNFVSNISTATVTFTETTVTNNTTLLNRIVTGAALNTITASIKNLLSNLNGSVTKLNNDITYQEITYENWLNLTQQEKENGNWDVTGVPANEGYTEADKCMLSDGVTSVEDMIQVGRKRVTYTSSASRTIHGYLDIPPQCVAIIEWKVVFVNANPSETFICLENNSANTYNFIAYSQYAGCNATWWNDTNSTIRVYVGATYSGAAYNYGDITYTFIKKVLGG